MIRIVNYGLLTANKMLFTPLDRVSGGAINRPSVPHLDTAIKKLSGWEHIEKVNTWGSLRGHPEEEIKLYHELIEPSVYLNKIIEAASRNNARSEAVVLNAAGMISADIASVHSYYDQFVILIVSAPEMLRFSGSAEINSTDLWAQTLCHLNLRGKLPKAGTLLLELSSPVRENIIINMAEHFPGIYDEMMSAVSGLSAPEAK